MYIYFIQKTEGGLVKIGTSANPTQRLVAMQRVNPDQLCIRGVALGSHAAEKRLHQRFDHLQVRDEWFKVNSEIEELLGKLPTWESVQAGGHCPRITSRSDTIRILYMAGFTMQEIGDHFDITRQRVQQIIQWSAQRQISHEKNKDKRPNKSVAEYLDQNADQFKDILDGE